MCASPFDVRIGSLVLPAPPSCGPRWIPLLNTACPWADELEQNYLSPNTAAATTRTAYLHGPRPLDSVYDQDESVHRVALSSSWSLNSFGYSPTPLSAYLVRVEALLTRALQTARAGGGLRPKPVIVSLTGQPAAVAEGIKAVCQLAGRLEPMGEGRSALVAVEVNLSCPNIRGTDVPPGFSPSFLAATLAAASALYLGADGAAGAVCAAAWRPVTIGLKVPPYTYPAQFSALLDALQDAAPSAPGVPHTVGFLTATNTLGGCMWTSVPEGGAGALPVSPERGFAGDGGMGGESIHPLALGCVARLRRMLDTSPHASVRSIALIAAGGCSSGAAARRFVGAGAQACGVATALGREGPAVFLRLRREIDGESESRL